jgi:hypothetical protein
MPGPCISGRVKRLLQNPVRQPGEEFLRKARRSKGEGRYLRQRSNDAITKKARRPQGIPSPCHGVAALPATERGSGGRHGSPQGSSGAFTREVTVRRLRWPASLTRCRCCGHHENKAWPPGHRGGSQRPDVGGIQRKEMNAGAGQNQYGRAGVGQDLRQSLLCAGYRRRMMAGRHPRPCAGSRHGDGSLHEHAADCPRWMDSGNRQGMPRWGHRGPLAGRTSGSAGGRRRVESCVSGQPDCPTAMRSGRTVRGGPWGRNRRTMASQGDLRQAEAALCSPGHRGRAGWS